MLRLLLPAPVPLPAAASIPLVDGRDVGVRGIVRRLAVPLRLRVAVPAATPARANVRLGNKAPSSSTNDCVADLKQHCSWQDMMSCIATGI